MRIAIVDYGIGNIGAIRNMLKRLGYQAYQASTEEEIDQASAIILPGVGAFDKGMTTLKNSGLIGVLQQKALKDKTPFLGICLGAHLMTKSSEEGQEDGLGFFNATTKKLQLDACEGRWLLPNIGWRSVEAQNGCQLLNTIDDTARFYFVHSYYLAPEDCALTSLTTFYGHSFACGLRKDNLHCVQFHPEKSHRFGFALLKNFVESNI